MSRTALLVLDVQSALIANAARGADILAIILSLVERARAGGASVVYLQHCHLTYEPMKKGAFGWHIHPQVEPKPGELVIEKTASDAFFETDLQGELQRLGIKRLVVCGLQTEYCLDATCRAAFSRGFEVVLTSDGHTTTDGLVPAEIAVQHHNRALANLAHPRSRNAVIPSAEIDLGC